MLTPKPIAYGYVRVSTAGLEDGTSLESQANAIEQFAAAQGFEIVKTFREIFTGSELWERPQLSLIRANIRAHKSKC